MVRGSKDAGGAATGSVGSRGTALNVGQMLESG